MPSLREPPRSSKPWCGQAQRLVAGRTQAGKTTLLNCLAAAIPGGERVVSVEEVFELRFPHPEHARALCKAGALQRADRCRARRGTDLGERTQPEPSGT